MKTKKINKEKELFRKTYEYLKANIKTFENVEAECGGIEDEADLLESPRLGNNAYTVRSIAERGRGETNQFLILNQKEIEDIVYK